MFANLKSLAVAPDARREYRIDQLDVVLTVLSATQSNRDYFSKALVLAQEQGRGRKVTVTSLAVDQERDAELFAAHVVVGWKGVKKEDGTPVPWSREAATEYLLAIVRLAPYLFDELRSFCKDESNFTAAALNPDGVAKNS